MLRRKKALNSPRLRLTHYGHRDAPQQARAESAPEKPALPDGRGSVEENLKGEV